jgi:hypothetical protein
MITAARHQPEASTQKHLLNQSGQRRDERQRLTYNFEKSKVIKQTLFELNSLHTFATRKSRRIVLKNIVPQRHWRKLK